MWAWSGTSTEPCEGSARQGRSLRADVASGAIAIPLWWGVWGRAGAHPPLDSPTGDGPGEGRCRDWRHRHRSPSCSLNFATSPTIHSIRSATRCAACRSCTRRHWRAGRLPRAASPSRSPNPMWPPGRTPRSIFGGWCCEGAWRLRHGRHALGGRSRGPRAGLTVGGSPGGHPGRRGAIPAAQPLPLHRQGRGPMPGLCGRLRRAALRRG
mmetsp:Transcript_53313/g.125347  ORF Transcript_53313/g.125347 Transcript_53313/m.125347 type:complete len:210 (+) Transcript_53313:153-782(+)